MDKLKTVFLQNINKKPKVLLVTGLFSPFQVELAYEINKNTLFEYFVVFTLPFASRRGRHWLLNIKEEYAKYIIVANKDMTIEKQASWARDIVTRINPQIVISGFCKGPIYKQTVKAAKSVGSNLAFWAEPPNLLYPKLIVKIYEKLILKRNLKDARFILSIGDRAVRIYKEIFSGDVYLIPYAQDLSLHFSIHKTPKSEKEKVVFLFSGQLVKRQNIRLVAKALVELYKRYPDKFRFVIGGYGTEELAFWKIVTREPDLKKQIIHDRDYKAWGDRVQPFSYSDVLVYPSKHSGWGLVVPEAMASGMVVISTPKVEAARYYIKDGINGILIGPALEQLIVQMEWCINNKAKVFEIGQRARIDAHKGTAENVAKQFCDIVKQYLDNC
ncbi:glycosyltransferase [Thermodesulfovibrionales bacterium]|nr:glycosyltransferase [Thermodesulfovibrionales bacterium]